MSKNRKKADAVATIGTYTDRNGTEKKRYLKIGVLFESDEGRLSLKLDAIPVCPGWSGFVSFFEDDRQSLPDGRQAQRSMPPAPEPTANPLDRDEDEDIPF